MAAQFSATNGPAARRERRWMWRASISLPVPDSPVISTEASDSATCSARRTVAAMSGVAHHQCVGLAGGGLQDRGDQVGVGRQRQELPRAVADRAHRRLRDRAWCRRRRQARRCARRPARAPGADVVRNSHSTRSTRASARRWASAVSASSAWSSFAPRAMAMRAACPSSPASEPMIRTRMVLTSPAGAGEVEVRSTEGEGDRVAP